MVVVTPAEDPPLGGRTALIERPRTLRQRLSRHTPSKVHVRVNVVLRLENTNAEQLKEDSNGA